MFKKVLIAAVAFLTVQMSDAQVVVGQRDYVPETTQKKEKPGKNDRVSTFACKFGLKAGVNLSSISSGTGFNEGFKMGVGWRAGAVANLRWGQRTENSLPGTGWFGLQPEIMYSNQTVGSDAGNISLNAVQVPIMIKIYPTSQLNIEVGPDFSYIFSASPDEVTFANATIKTRDIKGLNMGVAAGLGYDFTFGLTLGARYTYNFNKLANNLDWLHSNIQVTVGWLF